jgi:hypothetical protein
VQGAQRVAEAGQSRFRIDNELLNSLIAEFEFARLLGRSHSRIELTQEEILCPTQGGNLRDYVKLAAALRDEVGMAILQHILVMGTATRIRAREPRFRPTHRKKGSQLLFR